MIECYCPICGETHGTSLRADVARILVAHDVDRELLREAAPKSGSWIRAFNAVLELIEREAGEIGKVGADG